MAYPLAGLVLAGGFSTRMGTDKANLRRTPQSPPQWLSTLLVALSICDKGVAVAARKGQRLDGQEAIAGLERIDDPVEGQGPLAPIAHRMQQLKDYACLVLACDLPLIHQAALETLRKALDALPDLREVDAVAFKSPADKMPEPLCALYLPAIVPAMQSHLAHASVSGKGGSPRALLQSRLDRIKLIECPWPEVLTNTNTPLEWQSLRQAP